MSLIVLDFTTFLYGSSCNYVFFSLILATLLSFYIYLHPKSRMGSNDIDGERKEERLGPKKRALHELLCTKIFKIRDY